jgi:threonine/homoserine/homoserine lactone efflux protein
MIWNSSRVFCWTFLLLSWSWCLSQIIYNPAVEQAWISTNVGPWILIIFGFIFLSVITISVICVWASKHFDD